MKTINKNSINLIYGGMCNCLCLGEITESESDFNYDSGFAELGKKRRVLSDLLVGKVNNIRECANLCEEIYGVVPSSCREDRK